MGKKNPATVLKEFIKNYVDEKENEIAEPEEQNYADL